jgi:hypothetical protein
MADRIDRVRVSVSERQDPPWGPKVIEVEIDDGCAAKAERPLSVPAR